jgi:hypothetical protein
VVSGTEMLFEITDTLESAVGLEVLLEVTVDKVFWLSISALRARRAGLSAFVDVIGFAADLSTACECRRSLLVEKADVAESMTDEATAALGFLVPHGLGCELVGTATKFRKSSAFISGIAACLALDFEHLSCATRFGVAAIPQVSLAQMIRKRRVTTCVARSIT